MRKHIILALLVSAFVLVGCGNQTKLEEKSEEPAASSVIEGESSEAPAESSEEAPASSQEAASIPDLPTNGIALVEGQTVLFEAENAKPTDWKNSGWGGDATFVATDADAGASGGAFVTPSTGNVSSSRKFEIVIYAPKAGTVSMKVAYCRGGKNTKTATIDYSYVYQYRLANESATFTCVTADHTDSETSNWNWREIEFTFDVTQGLHTIEGFLDSANANTNAGCPCMDYFKFSI